MWKRSKISSNTSHFHIIFLDIILSSTNITHSQNVFTHILNGVFEILSIVQLQAKNVDVKTKRKMVYERRFRYKLFLSLILKCDRSWSMVRLDAMQFSSLGVYVRQELEILKTSALTADKSRQVGRYVRYCSFIKVSVGCIRDRVTITALTA